MPKRTHRRCLLILSVLTTLVSCGSVDGGEDAQGGDANRADAAPDSDAAAASDAAPLPIDLDWERTPGTVETAHLQVPSSVAAPEGLAVVVSWPAQASGARYAEGAPIVIEIPGGHTPGSLPPDGAAGFAAIGMVSINFIMPGGEQDGRRSGGVFDYRGPRCMAALADLVAFARGDTVGTRDDDTEVFLDDLLGYPSLDDQIGLVGSSNGGNLAVVSLDGADLHGVRWLSMFESPVGDQVVTGELSNSQEQNPAYQGPCTSAGCVVDYSSLAFDATSPHQIAEWGSPPGDADEYLNATGTIYFDGDGDRTRDASEYVVEPRAARHADADPLAGFVSIELRQALAAAGLSPTHLASVAVTEQFWAARDAGTDNHYAGAVSRRPDLAVMVLGTATDHGQPYLADHGNLVMGYAGWTGAGAALVRFNPDAAYLAGAPGSMNFVESPYGQVLSPTDLLAHLTPDSVDGTLIDRASSELADRVHAARWEDLTETLWP